MRRLILSLVGVGITSPQVGGSQRDAARQRVGGPMRLIRRGKLALLALLAAAFGVAALGKAAIVHAKVPGPNGLIAFSRQDFLTGGAVTYTISPAGGAPQPLLSPFESGGPHWSPDGSLVAVASTLDQPCCDVLPYSSVIVNPDGGSFTALPMQDPSVGTLCQIWAPDGRRLACDGENDNDASVNGVYTIRSSDGADLKRITNAGGMFDIPIDYSPDGTRIVFGRTGPNHECTTASGLFVVGADGGVPQRITPHGWCDDDGSWSPDGRWIAFEHRGSLFVVHPDGSDLTKIPLAVGSRAFGGDFSWSPDGQQLVFLVFVVTGPGQFYEGIATANADGTNVRQLTISPSFDNQPDWGPHPITP